MAWLHELGLNFCLLSLIRTRPTLDRVVIDVPSALETGTGPAVVEGCCSLVPHMHAPRPLHRVSADGQMPPSPQCSVAQLINLACQSAGCIAYSCWKVCPSHIASRWGMTRRWRRGFENACVAEASVHSSLKGFSDLPCTTWWCEGAWGRSQIVIQRCARDTVTTAMNPSAKRIACPCVTAI
ncbi:hypothetical protein BDW62DRAFT_6713 [Aspergillus aurantiobrunneus]